MEDQTVNATDKTTSAEPTLRPWTTPAFERTALKDALSGGNKVSQIDTKNHSS